MRILTPFERAKAAHAQLVDDFFACGMLAGASNSQVFDFFNKMGVFR